MRLLRRRDDRFVVTRVKIPRFIEETGGYGSALCAEPLTDRIYFSQSNGYRTVLARYSLSSGEFEYTRGFPGDLRDAIFASDGKRATFLGTFGLCHGVLDPLSVSGKERAGLGTYKWRLLNLGPRHLGVSGWASKAISIVDAATLKKIKTVRMWAPDLVVESRAHSNVRLCSFYGAEARTLDLESLVLRERGSLPYGREPYLHGEEIFVAAGHIVPADEHVAIEQIHRIDPDHVSVHDAHSLDLLRASKRIARLRGILGVDRFGQLAASTHAGIALLDPTALRLISSMEVGDNVLQFSFSSAANAAVALTGALYNEQLAVIRW